MKKKLLVLGCTGSIGSQTLDIARNMKDSFTVCGLSAGHSAEKLKTLCNEFNCPGTLFETDGLGGLKNLICNSNADIAVNGIAGSSGLEPSLLVLENKIDLALANKETVVMAWDLVKESASKNNVRILPVDSEHSAIFHLTQKIGFENINEILITASGGPFRNLSSEELKKVSVEDALKHPTWNMGKKITIDSATLGNKGLEVIEACRLFNMPCEKVKVLVHPQSLVHSLVRTNDGMLYAQISNPDMRHPILGALTYPQYNFNYLEKFDLFDQTMTFYKPRYDDFPMLKLAYQAAQKGACYTIAYNAANEVAVEKFINKSISFTQIPEIVENVLLKDWTMQYKNIEEVLQADLLARKIAEAK